MFGAVLRLLAVGEAGRRLGGYVKILTTRYLVLGAAGVIFLAATVFVILAVYWAINSGIANPIFSAVIMAGILALVGLLIVLIAYGITRERPESVSQALRSPGQAAQALLPSIEDVGRRIEVAARSYGPLRLTAAAAGAGLVAGFLAKRFRQI